MVRLLSAIAVSALLCACGSGGTTSDAGSAGGGGGSIGSAGGGSGGGAGGGSGGGAGGGSGGGGGSSGSLNHGSIALNSSSTNWTASASFLETNSPYTQVAQQGVCTLTRFTFIPLPDGGFATYVNAGPVTISAGSSTTVIDHDAGILGYAYTSGQGSFFQGGETVSFSAPGAPNGVPAFNATLTAPGNTTVGAWHNAARTIPKNQDLAFSWSPALSFGNLRAEVSSAYSSGSTLQVDCDFPPGTTNGSVPAAMLQQFDAGTATVRLYTMSTDTLHVGDWEIVLYADQYPASTPDGGSYVNVTFQ